MKAWLIAAFSLVGVLLAGAPAAYATEQDLVPICADWDLRGATGQYPDVKFGDAPAGSEVGKTVVKLTKPTEGTTPGVEFASKSIKVETSDKSRDVKVSYSLSGGASSAAGAVRLFAYVKADADTLKDAPDFVDATTGDTSGTLKFVLPEGKTIGTLGLVFDASNDSKGTVEFSDLTIGGAPVLFTKCTSPSPSTSTSASASASSSPSPSVSRSSAVPGGVVPSQPSLPVTGISGAKVLLIAAMLIVSGGAFWYGAARRKTTFRS